MQRRTILLILLITISSLSVLQGSENIHSSLDEYYNNLSLLGITERPYLNYKSFSTNNWISSDESHPWENRELAQTPLWTNGKSSLFLSEISLFQSYNLNTPHGMNDGGLWQGKGYNMALSGGIQFLSPYVEVTLVPELYFSQNQDYSILPANSWSGSDFGYIHSNIDTPQRFGSDPFWYGSLGQTQVRFNYDNWTLGIGNENIWLGPGQQSAIISSNNADGYPHVDFGLNRTETRAGDVEFRLWWGWLKSSEYYAPAPDSYQDFLSGFSLSYAPVFIPGLTLGFHKTSQVKLEDFSWYSLVSGIDLGLFSGMRKFGDDVYDGRASVTWSWMFPVVGFEFYGEWAREDFTSGIEGWLRKPEHASGFTLGVRQVLPWKGHNDRFFALNAEFSSLVWSMDYIIGMGWGGGFYRHHQTSLGYANSGQTIGAGFGTGGNMQHLGVDYYAPFGMTGLYFTRVKHDDSGLYSEGIANGPQKLNMNIPYQVAVGTRGEFLLQKGFSVGGNLAYIFDKNWNMIRHNDFHGFYLACTLKYRY